jgi:hypothetical protein
MNDGAFSPEERDRIRDLVLERARRDDRIAGGAIVGSFATGTADRWSDLDLAFALRGDAAAGPLLHEWGSWLAEEEAAVHLFDLQADTAIYRVFLLPRALQLDVSIRPERDFDSGPGFELVFGSAAPPKPTVPPSTLDLFGWAVVFAIHLRACVERGRLWQADYDLGELRERGLALACVRRGLKSSYGRGFDELPAELLARFADARAPTVTTSDLCVAAARGIDLLLAEAIDLDPRAAALASDLRGVERWLRQRAELGAPPAAVS